MAPLNLGAVGRANIAGELRCYGGRLIRCLQQGQVDVDVPAQKIIDSSRCCYGGIKKIDGLVSDQPSTMGIGDSRLCGER